MLVNHITAFRLRKYIITQKPNFINIPGVNTAIYISSPATIYVERK